MRWWILDSGFRIDSLRIWFFFVFCFFALLLTACFSSFTLDFFSPSLLLRAKQGGHCRSRECVPVTMFNFFGLSNASAYNGNYNAYVEVREGENGESVLRRFRRQVMSSNCIYECRRRRTFEDPQVGREEEEQQKKNVWIIYRSVPCIWPACWIWDLVLSSLFSST